MALNDKHLIATDEGDVIHARGDELGKLLGSDLPCAELVNYATSNLGFIGITLSGSQIRLIFRPSRLSEKAAVAAGFWLSDQIVDRLTCQLIDEKIEYRIFGSPTECRHFIFTCIDSNAQSRKSDFLARDRGLNTMSRGSPIWEIYRFWVRNRSLEFGEEVAATLHRMAAGRLTVAEPVGDNADLIMRYIGGGYKVYGPHWLRVAVGRRYEDGPDPHYGHWIAQAQREVLAGEAPRVHDVDAFFERPYQKRLRVRYTRIILPFRLGSDRRWILTASQLAEGLNLRTRA